MEKSLRVNRKQKLRDRYIQREKKLKERRRMKKRLLDAKLYSQESGKSCWLFC